ncbi:RNA-binding protein 4.2 isoform X2 [Conger conger]|uniref:RNA-binding protein 4.2 isoform X2 n=1 Tax=Conger conger TaxID=82655 RepID=UPI002A5AA948|nr:RNA-binding protein 4.2 isoform X2 [Conger conger]
MVKIFIGNLSQDTTAEDLRSVFSQYGTVTECDVLKRYGFVHMDSRGDAEEAIRNLNQKDLNGKLMSVQLSTSRLRPAPGMGDHTGCFVCGKPGHWSKDCHLAQNGGFGPGGPGGRGGGGFGFGFAGGRGFPRGGPGFARGGPGFPAGPGIPRGPVPGHFGNLPFGPRAGYAGEMLAPPVSFSRRPSYEPAGQYALDPAQSAYGGRPESAFPKTGGAAYESEPRYGGVDFYEKFRARPYATGGYDEDRRPSSLPAASPAISRERLPPSALGSYDRRPLPPAASSSGSSYYSRERSPIRRAPSSGDGALYERSRLSPLSSLSRSSPYDMPRARDPYSDRARYAY